MNVIDRFSMQLKDLALGSVYFYSDYLIISRLVRYSPLSVSAQERQPTGRDNCHGRPLQFGIHHSFRFVFSSLLLRCFIVRFLLG